MIRRRHRIRIAKRVLTCQPLEERRVLAASLGWDGPGLGSAELTYYIANSPNSLSSAETAAAIETALSAWSSAADITFTRTSQPGLRDSMDFTFAPIDGAGGTLAEAYFPDDVNQARIAGDVRFDSSEVWEVGNALGSRAMDLVWVAVHEIGHSLGLDHLNLNGSILAPYVSPNQFFAGLPAVDVAAIQKLYAAPTAPASNPDPTAAATPSEIPTVATPTTSTPITPTTTTTAHSPNNSRPFFQGRWYRWTSWHTFGGRLEATVIEHHNMAIPTDVNGDATTSPIDALQIVNYLNQLSTPGGNWELVGWHDTNADGIISAVDVLTVINVLNQGNVTSQTAAAVADSHAAASTFPNNAAPANSSPLDESEAGTTTDENEPDENDSETSEPPPIDSDLLGDDDTPPATPGLDCHHSDGSPTGNQGLLAGWLRRSSDQWFARLDQDADNSLVQDEVPADLWDKLVSRGVDANSDGLISLIELEAGIAAARAEYFSEQDANSDGLLTQDEVGQRVWRRLSRADTNGDAEVALAEFDAWLDARPPQNSAGDHHRPQRHNVDRALVDLGSRPRHHGFSRVR